MILLFKNQPMKITLTNKPLTSEFKLVARIVHLSLVPVIPGGKPPPKAAAIAAAFPIYIYKKKC
jgi:hypothetical protein